MFMVASKGSASAFYADVFSVKEVASSAAAMLPGQTGAEA